MKDENCTNLNLSGQVPDLVHVREVDKNATISDIIPWTC